MASPVYTPSASQWASAASHLELRDDPEIGWRYYRVDGVRYVSMQSGHSGKRYRLRADALCCECPWYAKTLSPCSHLVALELDGLESDLRASAITSKRARITVLYPPCKSGCGDLADTRDGLCGTCASDLEFAQRLERRLAVAGGR